jgi:HAD superfamily hydrolase (TIGR01509 family)
MTRAYFQNPKLEKLLTNAKVVIFDMNGLIIDDEPMQMQSYNAVLKKFKIRMSPRYWRERCLGRRWIEFITTLLKEHGICANPELLDAIQQGRNPVYRRLLKQQLKKITRPGALELLYHIHKNKKHKLALATSSGPNDTQMTIGQTGLNIKNKFDFIINGREVKLAKPDPEIYARVAKHFKIKPQNCLVIEDGPIGVLSAHRAKMKVIAVPNKFTFKPKTYKTDFKYAKCIINNLFPDARFL